MKRWTLFIGAVFLITGCTLEDSPKTSHFEHDHEVPHHWPDDLADAVSKIRIRLHPSGSPAALQQSDHEHHHDHEHEATDRTQTAQDEIADIVSWIPEIAADTNLSEQDWNQVDDAARSLSSEFNANGNEMTEANQVQALALCQLIEQLLQATPEHFHN